MYFYYRRKGNTAYIYVVNPDNTTECVGVYIMPSERDYQKDEKFLKSIIKLYRNRVEKKRE